jgi:hypothetical protein
MREIMPSFPAIDFSLVSFHAARCRLTLLLVG